MKICMLSRFFDLRNAGIGRYSQELLKELRRMGEEVITVSQDGGVPLGEGWLKYLVYTAFEAGFKIPKDCELYHSCTPMEAFHSPRPLTVFFHDLIPMLHLKKLETHYASGPFRMFRRWFGSNYFKQLAKIAVEKADALMCQSEQTKREVMREFGVEEIRVIRHGINPILEPKPKPDSTFRVGTLSYLDPRKRIDLLIEAFLDENVDGELVIGGEGVDKRRLEMLAKGDRRIRFLGFVPDEKLSDFYSSLDAFVFPSMLEGYGLPIVEAMVCKIPAVTLSDAIIPSDVKNRTLITDDITAWFKDPDTSGINLASNYKFAKLHDWKKCAEEHIKIFRGFYEKTQRVDTKATRTNRDVRGSQATPPKGRNLFGVH